MMKKILAMILAFVMVISMMPVTAHAATVSAIVRYYVGNYEDVATGETVKVDSDKTEYSTAGLVAPTGYKIAEKTGEIYFVYNGNGKVYYVDVKVEALNTTKDVIVSLVCDGKTVGAPVTVKVAASATCVSSSAVTIPTNYKLLDNSNNGLIAVASIADGYKYRASFYVDEIPTLVGAEKKTTAVLSEDLKVMLNLELTQYKWSDGTVTVDEAEAKAAVKAAGWNVTFKSTTLVNNILQVATYTAIQGTNTKNVIVSFVCNGKTIGDPVTVSVTAPASKVSSSAVTIPSGFTMANNSKNGIITESDGEYHATFYLNAMPAGSEKKETFVKSKDFQINLTVKITQYKWADGTITVDETEAKAAIKSLGYDVTLKSTSLEDDILWVSDYTVLTTTKDVTVSFVCDGKTVGDPFTVTVALKATFVALNDVTIPGGYVLAENDNNGLITEVTEGGRTTYHASFYLEQPLAIVSGEVKATPVKSKDGKINVTVDLMQYLWTNGMVTVLAEEAKAVLKAAGYDITILTTKLDNGVLWVGAGSFAPTTKNVTVSFVCNGNAVGNSVTVSVAILATKVSSDVVKFPDGYILIESSDNGVIKETTVSGGTTYSATFYVERVNQIERSEIKATTAKSKDNTLAITVNITQYVWSDGTVTVKEQEAIAAIEAAGYDDVVLFSTTLDNGVLWISRYTANHTTKNVVVSFICDGKTVGNSLTVTVDAKATSVSVNDVKLPSGYILSENSKNGVIFETTVAGVTEYRASFYVEAEKDDIEEKVEFAPMYRMHNPYTLENLFTTSSEERAILIEAGWEDMGFAWNAAVSGPLVYRMYNPYGDFHIYTMSEAEIEIMESNGWELDGIATCSANEETGIAIRRLFNPNVDPGTTCYHYYAIEGSAVIDELVDAGWVLEGIAWYAASVK